MADITTPEGREELRRKLPKDHDRPHIAAALGNLGVGALKDALDGLDIAQKAMRALITMEALSDLPPDYPEHLMEAELANWQDSAEWALDEALAEWDNWQGS